MSNLPKVPQRGDSQRLQQLASGLKLEHGTYGATVQRNPVGRPSSGGVAPQGESAVPVPEEHVAAARDVAKSEWANQFWAMMAQRFPNDPVVQMYATNAARIAEQSATTYFSQTPNFEW